MTTEKHTPGRLSAFGHILKQGRFAMAQNVTACGTGGNIVEMNEYAEGNARRLAACWNACEGIGTDTLESALGVTMVKGGFVGLWMEYCDKKTEAADLRAERDELLTQLKACVYGWMHGNDIAGPMLDAKNLLLQYSEDAPAPEEPETPPPHQCQWKDFPDGSSKCTTCGDVLPF